METFTPISRSDIMSWGDILKKDEPEEKSKDKPLDDTRIMHLVDAIQALENAKKIFEKDPKYKGSKNLIPKIIDSIEQAKEELS